MKIKNIKTIFQINMFKFKIKRKLNRKKPSVELRQLQWARQSIVSTHLPMAFKNKDIASSRIAMFLEKTSLISDVNT